MAQLKFGSAGITAKEIDISGPLEQEPVGIPAGVISTAVKGPAFVPVTVGRIEDFYAKFGKTDGKKFGPLAVTEWLRNAGALTFLRVLGIGNGLRKNEDGSVTSSGFVVGEEQPSETTGILTENPYANMGGVPGRAYFLGAFMSESAGSTAFSDAGLQVDAAAAPVIRGMLLAPSGVVLRLSSSAEGVNANPSSTLVGTDALASGSLVGSVVLLDQGLTKQDFVLLLNGHKGLDALYPNVITASFDLASPNYFANVLNKDPLNYQKAGHLLYTHWDVHPSTAVVTGSGLVLDAAGAGALTAARAGAESCAFITTSSLSRNTSNDYVPNFEAWTDRFTHAKSPWVISQKFGGEAKNLFRLHSLDSGKDISTIFKMSIENITPSSDMSDQYGSFDLVIRAWDDNDSSLMPLESFRGVNLNPTSDRYIAKIVGDLHVYYNFDSSESNQNLIVDGNYQSRSNLVRIEVSDDVDTMSIAATALPMGVRGIPHLVTSGSMPLANQVSSQLSVSDALKRAVQLPVPMRKNITAGSGAKISANPLLYWGHQFEHATSVATPNASNLQNASMQAFAKYFPDFALTSQKALVSDNPGEVDTVENGVLDCDRFNNNLFTLENIQVVTGSSGFADAARWDSAVYVRGGNIATNESTKTRRFAASDLIQSNRRFAKFSFIMQGGSDGVNIFDQQESDITNVAVTADMNDSARGLQNGPNVKAFTKALDIMKSTTNVDIQLLATPGIRHPVVTNEAINAVEERFDALYIMDLEQVDNNNEDVVSDDQLPSVSRTVDVARNRSLDSSFGASYFPDVSMTDPNTNTNVWVPPSVVVLGALALNDSVGHPWLAPAGMTRGALPSTLEARVKLSKQNMDALYDANINPIVAFPGNATSGTNPKGGVVVWGQKTLQASASALDRVNVRRLLITIRREVRDIARTIIFEPSREETLTKFSNAVRPRLERIQALAGIERFKVVIDASTTTQADIENNTLKGKIIVKPTKSIEFVSLDFNVTNNIE
jgi:phage tail sheath protein FI